MRPTEDVAFGTWAAELISRVLATGQFIPLPVKLMPNGLENVTEGFQYMREGKASIHSYALGNRESRVLTSLPGKRQEDYVQDCRHSWTLRYEKSRLLHTGPRSVYNINTGVNTTFSI
jgi:hypothetical protein